MDVEATRKGMGLSRKQLAEKAGVTESAVWSVEHGKNPRGGEEVRQAVLQALDPLAKPAESQSDTPPAPAKPGAGQPSGGRGGKKLVPSEPPADWVVKYEWNGILNGDPCKVNGEPGAATFKEHVVTGEGKTWCTVTMLGKWRSFDPDRVVAATSKGKRKMPGEAVGQDKWTLRVLSLANETHDGTYASYADARAQAKIEVEHGGRCEIINHLGTVIEEMPSRWTEAIASAMGVEAKELTS